MIKTGLLGIILGLVFAFGVWKFWPTKIEIAPLPQKFDVDFSKSPSESIVGKVASVSGNVLYIKRLSEEPVLLDKDTIFQGESIIASDSGTITVDFNGTSISLEPKTQVDIIQTLPKRLVFNQISGTATYFAGSVRVKRLLVEIVENTKIEIKDNITKVTGVGKIAYNDRNFDSKVLEFSRGKSIIFDDNLRAVVK